MKRITKVMCLIAMLVLVGTSCKKTETTQSFKGILQGMTYEEADGSKMYVEGTNAMFEQNDHVMLFNVNPAKPSSSTAGLFYADMNGQESNFYEVAGHEGELEPVKPSGNSWFAYYPGDLVYPNLATQNRSYFRLDTVQIRRTVAGNAVIPVMYAASADKSSSHTNLNNAEFVFQQIGGAMGLKLYNSTGAKTVSRITLTDNALHLAGYLSLKVDKINPITMTNLIELYDNTEVDEIRAYCREIGYDIVMPTEPHTAISDYFEPNYTITLNCGDAGIEIGTSKPANPNFYIGLRPFAFTQGFVLHIEFTDGTSATVNSVKNNKIKPGVIKNFSLNLNSYMD
jgi:hypothetical protein